MFVEVQERAAFPFVVPQLEEVRSCIQRDSCGQRSSAAAIRQDVLPRAQDDATINLKRDSVVGQEGDYRGETRFIETLSTASAKMTSVQQNTAKKPNTADSGGTPRGTFTPLDAMAMLDRLYRVVRSTPGRSSRVYS